MITNEVLRYLGIAFASSVLLIVLSKVIMQFLFRRPADYYLKEEYRQEEIILNSAGFSITDEVETNPEGEVTEEHIHVQPQLPETEEKPEHAPAPAEEPAAIPEEKPEPEPAPTAEPEAITETKPEPAPAAEPVAIPEEKPEPASAAEPVAIPEEKPEPAPAAAPMYEIPVSATVAEPLAEPKPKSVTELLVLPDPDPAPEPGTQPSPAAIPEDKPESAPEAITEARPEPAPEPKDIPAGVPLTKSGKPRKPSMSMKKEELLAIAEWKGVAVPPDATKAEMLRLIESAE